MSTTVTQPRITRTSYVIASALSALIFGPVTWSVLHNPDLYVNDYPKYLTWIEHMFAWGSVTRPNFLYPVLVIIAHTVLPFISWNIALWIVTLASDVGLTLVLMRLIRGLRLDISPPFVIVTALVIQLVAPIAFPIALFNHHFYYGFLTPNVYHNPPVSLCIPLALCHFTLLLRALGVERNDRWVVIMLPVLLILSALAKPNYLLCVLPAIVVWCLLSRNRQIVNRRVLIWSLIVPGILMLAWQFLFAFVFQAYDSTPEKIVFAPFAALATHSSFLVVKLLLSILFPLVMVILYWERSRQDEKLLASWLLFTIGAIFAYLFAESGVMMSHMNFLWGAQIAVFILFVYSTIFFIRIEERRNVRFYVTASLLGLHVLSGIVWYLLEWRTPGQYW